MEIERAPHRTTSTPTTTSELFICFTSRLSHSSSMRLSSKSILSPGRTAAAGGGGADRSSSSSTSLTTSLSRRLRHNGSLRGGAQSPAMFPATTSTTKKSRGSSAFAENPEPSSPKVTCIGQVRVKTKKQGKKMKMRACRSKRISGGGGGGSGGEASFRRVSSEGVVQSNDHHHHLHTSQSEPLPTPPQDGGGRNQRWVHLPLTICETLKGLGSEFSCLLPCKSSCFSSGDSSRGERGEEERENGGGGGGGGGGGSSCGAVFRWLVSLQEGEGGDGRRRDIELVVGGGDEDEEMMEERERGRVMERECSRRRSIFDDMEFDDLFNNVNNNVCSNNNNNGGDDDNEGGRGGEGGGEGEEGGRVSVCVPPKNALLLMRCRSDPMKMASLSRKFWDPPLIQPDDVDVEVDEGGGGVVEEVKEEELVEVKVENRVEIDEEVEVREEEVIEVKEAKTDEIEEESVKLEDGDDEIDEMCEDLEIVEPKVEALAVFSDEFEEKIEEDDEIPEEFQEVRQDETEELQGIENREETVEDQGFFEECEVDEPVLQNVEETLVVEGENEAIGCSIETITVEEKVEEGENEQGLIKMEAEMVEDEGVEAEMLLEDEEMERVREESSELSTDSTTSCTSSEESTAESKESDSNLGKKEQEQEEEEVLIQGEARKSIEKEKKKPNLPDCLLLMMCEPKLSMEVSKETWVCTTDFMRWLPERHPAKKPTKVDGADDQSSNTSNKKTTKAAAVAAQPPLPPVPSQVTQPGVQPGRSSISFPANMIEQKQAKAGVGYEPFLTRCKSAPMRSTVKFALPELACSMWGRENGRKLEPHRPATCGVGAAGVGF